MELPCEDRVLAPRPRPFLPPGLPRPRAGPAAYTSRRRSAGLRPAGGAAAAAGLVPGWPLTLAPSWVSGDPHSGPHQPGTEESLGHRRSCLLQAGLDAGAERPPGKPPRIHSGGFMEIGKGELLNFAFRAERGEGRESSLLNGGAGIPFLGQHRNL